MDLQKILDQKFEYLNNNPESKSYFNWTYVDGFIERDSEKLDEQQFLKQLSVLLVDIIRKAEEPSENGELAYIIHSLYCELTSSYPYTMVDDNINHYVNIFQIKENGIIGNSYTIAKKLLSTINADIKFAKQRMNYKNPESTQLLAKAIMYTDLNSLEFKNTPAEAMMLSTLTILNNIMKSNCKSNIQEMTEKKEHITKLLNGKT